MKYLLLILLSSCGALELSGNVTITHKVDVMTDYFIAYCEDLYPNNKELQKECVDEEIINFIRLLEGSSK